jgi:hypothetical protein
MPETGHYISKVGDSRIVWTRAPNGNEIMVLLIFAPNK